MRSDGRRGRRNAAAGLALAVALWTACASAAARAADAEHPLLPSHHRVAPGTLFGGGIPHDGATPEAAPTSEPRALLNEGAALYGTHCRSCHGADLRGAANVPSLMNAGGAATDFYVSTGRMPIALESATGEDPHGTGSGRVMAASAQDDHVPALFDTRETAALDAYVSSRAERTTPIPQVRTDDAALQHGRSLFESNCQACHGAAGQGATAGSQWTALPLYDASPTQIGEAIRIGPGVMPHFTRAQLSDRDVDAVATYVRYLATTEQNYGGSVMAYLGPIAEGGIGVFIGLGALFWVVYFTGTKADGRRLHEPD